MTPGEYLAFLKRSLVVGEHGLGRAWGSLGDRSPDENKFYSEFAGILQVKNRQGVSGVRMLILIFGEGSMRSFWARNPWQNEHPKKH
jgi:hypothetical protein